MSDQEKQTIPSAPICYSILGLQCSHSKVEKIVAVWNACVEADIPIPEQVSKFFPGCESTMPVTTSDFFNENLNLLDTPTLTVEKDTHRRTFEIDLTKLPRNIEFIRFGVSW